MPFYPNHPVEELLPFESVTGPSLATNAKQTCEGQRWSTSTFGHHPPLAIVAAPEESEEESDAWTDEEEHVAEFQYARHISRFGRSAFDLAPVRPASTEFAQVAEVAPNHPATRSPYRHTNRSRSLLDDVPPRPQPSNFYHGSQQSGASSIPRCQSLPHGNQRFLNEPSQQMASPPMPPPKSPLRGLQPLSTSASAARRPPMPWGYTSTSAQRAPADAPSRHVRSATHPSHSPPRPPPARPLPRPPLVQTPTTVFEVDSIYSPSETASPTPVLAMSRSMSASTSATACPSTTSCDTPPCTFYAGSASSKESQGPLSYTYPHAPPLEAVPLTAKESRQSSTTSTRSTRFSRISRVASRGRTTRASRSAKNAALSELPSGEAIAEALNYGIYAEDGVRIPFGSLYPTANTNPSGPPPRLVVFFVRVFFSGPCQDYIRSSINKLDMAALAQANISVAIVANGHRDGIRGFRKNLKCPFPIFSDPERGLYSLLNFRSALDMGTDSLKSKYNQPKLPLQMAQGFFRGMFHFPQGMSGGSLNQLGGAVVLGPQNRCEFIHRMAHSRDYMPAGEVVRAAGCIIPLKGAKCQSFHPVNPAADKQMRALQSQLRCDPIPSVPTVTISRAEPSTTPLARSASPKSNRHLRISNIHTRRSDDDPNCKQRPLSGTSTIHRPPRPVSEVSSGYGSQPRDMALYRLLAEYLESSECLDRFSCYSQLSPFDSAPPTEGRCHQIGPQDFWTASASEFKAAVQQQYAASVTRRPSRRGRLSHLFIPPLPSAVN